MLKSERTRAYIVRSFTDCGTGERFTGGTMRRIEAGAFANYQAAGLVREATAEDAAAQRKQRPRRSAARA